MKELALNFNLYQPSSAGVLYERNSFIKELSYKVDRGLLLLEKSGDYQATTVDLRKVVGIVDSYKLKENGEVIFTVSPIGNEKELETFTECTPVVFGYEEDGKVNTDSIICLRPTIEYSLTYGLNQNQ